jgi:GTP-binding protein
MQHRNDIRNIAIIAHVDHGKTTLVDALLKQSHVFRDNQKVGELVMDQNALERERGITIMAKNTAVVYRGVKINIIDTPGHADFSGEVERVISMADGCLLLVDSAEGPMPQTRYVLAQAMKRNLAPIVVINKVDRKDARIAEVLRLTQDLFLELATSAEQLDFPVLYASGREGTVSSEPGARGQDVAPLFDCILQRVPPPAIQEGAFQMMVSNLDYDSHKGRIASGGLEGQGRAARTARLPGRRRNRSAVLVAEVLTHLGLTRYRSATRGSGRHRGHHRHEGGHHRRHAGESGAAGRAAAHRGRRTNCRDDLRRQHITIRRREGEFCPTRQLRKRLYKELETNLSLRVQDTNSADTFLVKGRGELHLAVLIETMRREGYEFEVSKPEAITKMVDGTLMEPVEDL